MQLEHSFTVPVGIDDAWQVLLDIERIAPCMPGAALDAVDGDDFTGTVKVKLGPINLTYKGKASFVEKDEAAHRVAINAQGRDARGNGTAAARVTATLTEQNAATRVDVVTDLDITGKPAQFGRGVMADVGNKLIGQFADCLAGQLSGEQPAAAPGAAATPAKKAPGAAAKKAPAARKASPRKAATKKAAPASAPAEPAVADAAKSVASAENAVAEPVAETVEEPITEPAAPAEPAAAAEPPAEALVIPHAEVEPIDLLEQVGPALAKRLIPVVAGLVVAVLILIRLRRRD